MPYRQPPPDAERCIADVSNRERWPGSHRCERRGIVERDGKLYCKTHDPVAIENAQKEKFAAWDNKWATERIRAHKLATWDTLLEACKAALDAIRDEDEHLYGVSMQLANAISAAAEEQTNA